MEAGLGAGSSCRKGRSLRTGSGWGRESLTPGRSEEPRRRGVRREERSGEKSARRGEEGVLEGAAFRTECRRAARTEKGGERTAGAVRVEGGPSRR